MGGGILIVPTALYKHMTVGTSLVAVLGNAAGATASHAALG